MNVRTREQTHVYELAQTLRDMAIIPLFKKIIVSFKHEGY